MRTLGAISASWTVCWATTYTFEPAFYDVEILRRLGDPPLNAVVLADDLRLARALDEMAGLDAAEQWSLRHANRTYLLRTVRLPGGVFHPKTILVGNRKHGRLLVGSGNIGFAGLDRGREVFHESDSADPDDAPSFASYRSWMDRIVSYVDDGLLRHRWLALHGELPWLGANADGARFLHNWSTPIVDQLVAGWQNEVR